MHRIYEPNEEELRLLELGAEDVNVLSAYLFRSPYGGGWIFDHNFTEKGKYQVRVHNAKQPRIIIMGGFGSGKTRCIGASAVIYGLLMQDLKFLNVAPTAWQARQMFSFIVDELGEGTPLEKFIYKKVKSPYPKITLAYRIRGYKIMSQLEFMSVDENAKQILSYEGDWVNIDEAGLIENLEEVMTNLASRLRGRSIKGDRERLGRLSITTNSWDNDYLWLLYDMARTEPDDYLTITVSSKDNKNVTDEQLRIMLKDIPPDEHQRYIDGVRPMGKGEYFNHPAIYAAENDQYAEFIRACINDGISGYELFEYKTFGVTSFRTPYIQDNTYIVIGDPGTGNAPFRNSPVIFVWNVEGFPEYKACLAAMYWGFGNNSIMPFIRNLLDLVKIYKPVYTAIDSTGPQKNMAELINIYARSDRVSQDVSALDWIVNYRDVVSKNTIHGLDFSGTKKNIYLVNGRLLLESRLVEWPSFVKGLRSQLSNYRPEVDKPGNAKIAQDLVATFCMSAYVMRILFNLSPESLYNKHEGEDTQLATSGYSRSILPDSREIGINRISRY